MLYPKGSCASIIPTSDSSNGREMTSSNGRKTNCMMWLGMEFNVALMRVYSTRHSEEVYVFHPSTLFLELSVTNLKVSLVGLDIKIRKPKYLPKEVLSGMLKELNVKSLSNCLQFLEKLDFE